MCKEADAWGDDVEENEELNTALLALFRRWEMWRRFFVDEEDDKGVDLIGEFCSDARERLSELLRPKRIGPT